MTGRERIGFCVGRLCCALLLIALTTLPAAAARDVTCAEWLTLMEGHSTDREVGEAGAFAMGAIQGAEMAFAYLQERFRLMGLFPNIGPYPARTPNEILQRMIDDCRKTPNEPLGKLTAETINGKALLESGSILFEIKRELQK